ncbi:hypothetical protein LZC95_49750 [Pendulispora brunnea]|uniref:Galactose oxidase n=1 Tax=Pendulispora brunnea TaxID=2905690 RepID=A0ABZ2K753_9BACT
MGARDVPAEVAEGYAIFRDALGTGSHVLHRVTETGYEDFVTFEHAPAQEKIEYELALGEGAAGLRLVGNVLEIIDASGTPRLHVSPPWLLGEDGTRTDATLAVDDCAVDREPAAPWGRVPVAPGANHCKVTVSWSGAHYPAVLDPEWGTTGSMVSARYDFRTITLPSGQVLALGGGQPGNVTVSGAELYDPTSRTWAATGSMHDSREAMTATLLEDGTVLAAGGWKYEPPGNPNEQWVGVEVYNPRSGVWSSTMAMSIPRGYHTATRLLDGRVLATGGDWPDNEKTAEVYDPFTKTWTRTPNMASVRWAGTADRLSDGRVLVVGGWKGPTIEATETVEIFDPTTGKFNLASSLSAPREEHASMPLPDGKVLIFGGRSAFWDVNGPPPINYVETEIYDPITQAFTPGGSMPAGRVFGSATLASRNYVTLAGGSLPGTADYADALIYDVRRGVWQGGGQMSNKRNYPGAATLSGESILVCGGIGTGGTLNTCDVLDSVGDGTQCGDAIRRPAGEECDLGQWNGTRATCSTTCRAQDIPLLVDASTVRTRSRTIGRGAHPLAGWSTGALAAAFVETNDGVPTVRVAGVGLDGVPSDKAVIVGAAPSAIAGSDPVFVPIADEVGVVAFTDFDADGDLLGVALRRVYPMAGMAGPLVRANTRTSFSQFDADVLNTGSQVVVAWSDDSDLNTGPDIFYRVFDTALNPATTTDQPLATSPEAEGSVALARFGDTWAAAWRVFGGGAETIRVKARSTEWTVGPFTPGPSDSRPALAEIDSSHLLVAFVEGADLSNAGTAKDGRLRIAILDTAAPGATLMQEVVTADSNSRDLPTMARAGTGTWLAWHEKAANAEFGQLIGKELVWDPTAHTLDVSRATFSLPRSTQLTDRRRPVLISNGSRTFAAVWDDASRVFGSFGQKGDVMLEAISLPFGRLP